jgi:Transposase DDE domain
MISFQSLTTKEETMSAAEVYHQVRKMIGAHIDSQVDESTLERITLLVTGMIAARNASPAQVAKALDQLQLTGASAESLERRIRRLENDGEMKASLCFHPFARAHLRYGRPTELLLVLDPTTQEDKIVMVSVAVWFRGRALPLAWAIWPGNTPLEGDGFWKRIDRLFDEVVPLLPAQVSVTLLADRAFGCPALIDLLVKRNWHYILRIQGQTVCQDRMGRQRAVQSLVPYRNQRAKLRGLVFKKNGWRSASVVAFWGKRHDKPLCLVSDLKPGWVLLHLYRRRYPIEAHFRDCKSHGWRWEQGQVKNLLHVERLLTGMALATWFVLLAGTWQAQRILSKPPSGKRRTRPWNGKMSLFAHGLEQLHHWLGNTPLPSFFWHLSDWQAPNWEQQIYAHHARAYVFA